MLKEKVVYSQELPVSALIADIRKYHIHFHDDPEIVFVLEGSIHLRVGYYNYLLKQGDVFVVNDRELHSFEHTDEPNMILTMQLELDYFSRYYDNLRNTFFITDMAGPKSSGYEALCSILIRTVKEIIRKGAGYERNVIENMHNLISCLLSDFRYFEVHGDKFINAPRKQKNKDLVNRLNRITNYMYSNYSRKISLNEIAEEEHLSIYYLSHLIKEATGLSFQELLSFIRVEQSEHLLLGTDNRISTISQETGFSAVRYYRAHFEKWFGMPPEDYREKYTGKISDKESNALMKKYTPGEIRKTLREQSQHSSSIFTSRSDRVYNVLDIDVQECMMKAHKSDKNDALYDTLIRMGMEKVSYAAEPYRTFRKLNEKLIMDEYNFAVATPDIGSGSLNRLSIVYYNIDRDFEKTISFAGDPKEIFDVVADYDMDSEMLLNFHGLSGEFNISRYRLSQDNLIALYEEAAEEGVNPVRKKMVAGWKALPSVEFSELTASGTLGIHIALKGFAAELILIDRK